MNNNSELFLDLIDQKLNKEKLRLKIYKHIKVNFKFTK